MPLINYFLKNPADIRPFGREPDTSMHWFGLTDGYYWLTVGDKTLFEYTDEINRQWGKNDLPYPDYNIVRLLEDLSELFAVIAESIPVELYQMAKSYDSLYDLYAKASRWLDQFEDEGDDEAHLDTYETTIRWLTSRRLDSGHLKQGPHISFFRCEDRLSIVWKCDLNNDDGIPVWTAGNGEIEIPYQQFVDEVKEWGMKFFNSMQDQVGKAVERDWGATQLDKARLIEEQKERITAFANEADKLLATPEKPTDWGLVRELIQQMPCGTT
jgi:hypothetical protein